LPTPNDAKVLPAAKPLEHEKLRAGRRRVRMSTNDATEGPVMAEGDKPDFEVFAVREREGGIGKDIFTKIGVAYKRRDGGVGILLDSLPLSRRVVVLAPAPEREKA
jgi:hypothetical protein